VFSPTNERSGSAGDDTKNNVARELEKLYRQHHAAARQLFLLDKASLQLALQRRQIAGSGAIGSKTSRLGFVDLY
jgi:hypothetical protein